MINILFLYASVTKAGKWAEKLKPKISTYPSLALALLAALTPKDITVRILNEEFEEINFDDKVDLVGISFLTPAAPRAYEIADNFRKKGITVVMGGVHVSAIPEDAMPHADALVVGEAEEVWAKLLEDFKNGTLQKVYKAVNYTDLSKLPYARLDLINRKNYITTNVIQASRGCSLGCEFCSIEALFGKKPRFRPVKEVIAEIKTMPKQKVLLFTDDNLIMSPSYAEELFTAIKPLKILWMGEASWTIGHRHELLKLMKESGCIGLLIGFESIQEQIYTKKVSKHKDMRIVYKNAIRNLHKYQIVVLGAFVFGFDNDDASTLNKTLRFCLKNHVDIAEFNAIIPFPGTPLYRRLSQENRILTRDWSKYTYEPPGKVFQLKNMTNDELSTNIKRIYRNFYSYRHLIPRLIRSFFIYRDIRKVIYLLIIFKSFRKKTDF